MRSAALLVLLLVCVSCEEPTKKPAPKRSDLLYSYTGDYGISVPPQFRLRTPGPSRTNGWAIAGRYGGCPVSAWYDFVPGSDLAYTKQLIATEALEATAALRRFSETASSTVTLAKREAEELSMVPPVGRRVYLIPLEDTGVLIVHCLSSSGPRGPRPDACAEEHRSVAASLLGKFVAEETGLALAKKEKKPKPPLKELSPIPENLEACFVELKAMLGPEEVKKIMALEEQEMIRYHHGLGRRLRNQWGLWGGSPLSKHLRQKGLRHPDDMSAVILRSFWRHLHNKPLAIEQQAAHFKAYWEQVKREQGQNKSH